MWVEPSWRNLQDATSLRETRFGMKQTSFSVIFFSMKCTHPFASVAGQHTFMPVLDPPVFCCSLTLFHMRLALGTIVLCVVLNYRTFSLGRRWVEGVQKACGGGQCTNQGLCCFSQHLDPHWICLQIVTVVEYVPCARLGLNTMYALVNLIRNCSPKPLVQLAPF